jgi:hypothetical protein
MLSAMVFHGGIVALHISDAKLRGQNAGRQNINKTSKQVVDLFEILRCSPEFRPVTI